jgi:membrane dipeptidase
VIGIVGVGAFLGDVAATSETMFRHVDHAVSLVGPEHVGLGLDFLDNMPPTPTDAPLRAEGEEWPPKDIGWPADPAGAQIALDECRYFGPEQLVGLVETMLDHGYAEDAVRGIVGGNFKRVYEEFE